MSKVSHEAAMTDLKSMFPELSLEVIESVLQQNCINITIIRWSIRKNS